MNEARPSRSFLVVVAIAVTATVGMAAFMRYALPTPPGGIAVGKPAPTITVEGWLNGDGPLTKPLKGGVYVVHAWFPECVYCRKEAPELIAMQKKYSERGVKFIGLTFHGERRLEDLREYLDDTGMQWLNGYGARKTLEEFETEAFPSIWVIDAEGQIVWNRSERSRLEDGIEAALR